MFQMLLFFLYRYKSENSSLMNAVTNTMEGNIPQITECLYVHNSVFVEFILRSNQHTL